MELSPTGDAPVIFSDYNVISERDPLSYNWPVEDGELDDSYGTCPECGGKLDVRPVYPDVEEFVGTPGFEKFCTECGTAPGQPEQGSSS